MEIRALGPADLDLLLTADVFEEAVNPEFAREFLADPRHHLVVAIDAGQVVGFVSGIHYLHPDAAPQMFINEVGVEPSHQRRGLGKAMMQEMFAVARKHRCTEAWVLTDRSNEAARALYVSAGGREGADDDVANQETVGYTFDFGS